jgi:hypothetical protein
MGQKKSKCEYRLPPPDMSGKGFTKHELDSWDWKDLLVLIEGSPITQLDLDRSFRTYVATCTATTQKDSAFQERLNLKNKTKTVKKVNKAQQAMAGGAAFRDLDPKFSKEVIEMFATQFELPCAESMVRVIFSKLQGKRLNFLQFFTQLYTFCKLPPEEVLLHLFAMHGAGDIDDINDETLIDQKFIVAVMNDVHGDLEKEKSVGILLSLLPIIDGMIDFGTVLRYSIMYPALIFPVLTFQYLLRRKMMGEVFWSKSRCGATRVQCAA